jgi:hypothetical protein
MRAREIARTLLTVLVAGVALGAAVRGMRHASPPVPKIASLGVPWLAVAFAVGALERERLRAALAAASALVLAVGVYYLLEWRVEGQVSALYAAAMTVAWSAAAAVAGAGFGTLGAAWRRRRGAFAAAALSGAFVGEAGLLLVTWHSEAAYAVLGCELALGVALPFALARRRELAQALLLTAVVALTLAGTEAVIRAAMHGAGWAGG